MQFPDPIPQPRLPGCCQQGPQMGATKRKGERQEEPLAQGVGNSLRKPSSPGHDPSMEPLTAFLIHPGKQYLAMRKSLKEEYTQAVTLHAGMWG